MPELLESFLGGYNVTFFAFGQTGTGKTHTLFGSQLELVESFDLGTSAGRLPELWGLFPRVLVSAVTQLKTRDNCKLTANVLELYMGQCLDLLNNKTAVTVSKWGGADFGAFGLREMNVASLEDVARIMKVMQENRSTRSTSMNDTSSRSHCIASLSLTTVDDARNVRRSTFMFADLAGSERLPPSTNAEGIERWAINWDLMNFGRTIDLVVEAIRKGGDRKKAILSMRPSSILCQLMTKPLNGTALQAMVVCISQSLKNNGESWFSLSFGERLHRLTANVERAKTRNLDELLKETEEALEEQTRALAQLDRTPAGRQNAWYGKRVCMQNQLTQEIEFLNKFR